MSSNTTQQFLTSISSYLIQSGGVFDPKGKEGLARVTQESFEYGTKNYPKANELFNELEMLGASLLSSVGREYGDLGIRAPKESMSEAKKLLDEIFENVETSEESLNKIKLKMSTEIDALESSDREYALERFLELMLGVSPLLGTKESLKKISLADLKGSQKRFKQNPINVEVAGPENIKFSKKIETENMSRNDISSKSHLEIIKKELEQKIIFYGYHTGAENETDHIVRAIANSVISSGLAGLSMEKIREENSAAYYAYSSMTYMKSKGAFFIYAGVSEDNLLKTLQLMNEIYQTMLNGDFEPERLKVAKEYFKGNLSRTYDDIERLYTYNSNRYLFSGKVEKFTDLIERIDHVTIEDVSNYFSSFMNNKPYLVINGTVKKSNEDKLREKFG